MALVVVMEALLQEPAWLLRWRVLPVADLAAHVGARRQQALVEVVSQAVASTVRRARRPLMAQARLHAEGSLLVPEQHLEVMLRVVEILPLVVEVTTHVAVLLLLGAAARLRAGLMPYAAATFVSQTLTRSQRAPA